MLIVTALLRTHNFRSRNPFFTLNFLLIDFPISTHKPGIFLHKHEHGVLLSVIQRVFGEFLLRFMHTNSLKVLMEI